MNDLHLMAAKAREAAWTLASSSLEKRNAALLAMADTLCARSEAIFAANSEDIAAAAGDNVRLLYVEGAGHGMARYVDETAYYEALLGFYDEAVQR